MSAENVGNANFKLRTELQGALQHELAVPTEIAYQLETDCDRRQQRSLQPEAGIETILMHKAIVEVTALRQKIQEQQQSTFA